jgi:hypothetical protein
VTKKLAIETVKASYPKACCRFNWYTIEGERTEYYSVHPNLATSGNWVGKSYHSPTILGKGSTKKDAWIAAAHSVIGKMQLEGSCTTGHGMTESQNLQHRRSA